MKSFENELVVYPRPMSDKQLMKLFEVGSPKTWRKLLKPLAWELAKRNKEGRRAYNKEEIQRIFDFLGQPTLTIDSKAFCVEYIKPKPMTSKELMFYYEVKHRLTWQNMIKPIASKLWMKFLEHRYYFTINEVKIIFEFLGQPFVFRELK